MLSEDVFFQTVRELGDRIRSRELSPVELTEGFLDRSEKLGSKLNAYATLTPELALRQAHAAEKEVKAGHYRGPLHGVPYAAKDLVAVQEYPTTWGAKPFAEQRLSLNATVIERLNQAGAVLIGKAAKIELAGGLGYSAWQCLSDRSMPESLEHRVLDMWFFKRLRSYRRCGPRTLGLGIGHRGIDPLPLGMVRRCWHAPELWAREPLRCHGDRLEYG